MSDSSSKGPPWSAIRCTRMTPGARVSLTDRHTACRVSPSRHPMLGALRSLPMDGSNRSPQRKDDARASWVREETPPPVLAVLLAFAALAVPLVASVSASAQTPASVAAPAPERPNVLLIVTDDQRWDTLDAMPVVQQELMGRGVTFSHSFVSTRCVVRAGRASLRATTRTPRASTGRPRRTARSPRSTMPRRWPRGCTTLAIAPACSASTSTPIRAMR